MDQKKNILTPIQRFWGLLKPDYAEIKNVYVYAIFSGLIALSLPLGIQAIVNLTQGGQINSSWVLLVVFVVFGVAATGILQIRQLKIAEKLQQKIFTRSAFEFTYRIPRIKMEALYKHYAPELMNRFFDTMSIQKGLSKILIDFSSASLQVIFGLILLSFYHPFFIIFSLLLLFIVFIIFKYTANRGLQTSLEESKHKYQIAYWLEELSTISTTFKLAGKTDLPLKRTNKFVEKYLDSRDGHFKVLLQQYSLMVIFKVIVISGLLVIGGILVMEQLMNIGQFIAAEIIILLIMNSVEKLVFSFETIYDVLTALEKIGQVTDLELETEEGICSVDEFKGEGINLELSNVSFKYPNQRKNILRNLSFKVNRGEKVVISGNNGGGKSTLLRVLTGLYEHQDGLISLNGMPIGSVQPDTLKCIISDSISQEQLFQGTIMENITLGRENIPSSKIHEVVKALFLEDYIKGQNKGLETEIQPLIKKIPRSIRQKILLARSIVNDPKLLLLEDAFEFINNNEREKIIDFITDNKNPYTLIAISSSEYFAKKVNRILLFENGEIIKEGTYQDIKNEL